MTHYDIAFLGDIIVSKIREVLKKRILLCDGGMGSSIQKYNLSKKDFGGFDNFNEILLRTRPDIIEEIHSKFLEAGSDIIETNTFGVNFVVLKEVGLTNIEKETYDLNRLGAEIAKKTAEKYSTAKKPRFVIGSVGPGTKLPSLGQISFDELYESYKISAKGLIDGGVDMILIETCQDILQAKTAVIAVKDAMSSLNIDLPIFVQVTIEESGTMLVGSDIDCVVTSLGSLGIDGLGINCATGPHQMKRYIEQYSLKWPGFISMQPNAGRPVYKDGQTVYDISPEEFAKEVIDIVENFRVNIVGGCCGTTYEHIKALANNLKSLNIRPSSFVPRPSSFSSLYTSVPVKQEASIFIIGERNNASGSKAFREMLEKEDIDAMADLAKKQSASGANMLDISVAVTGRNEKKDMEMLVRRLVKDSVVPLMIDSYDPDVIETALKCIPGRSVINSINLEAGEEKLGKICSLCNRFGAGVVALAIDEEGMAKTLDRKISITKRLIKLAHKKYGVPLNAIFIDPLTFTIATGNSEDRDLANQTLKAVEKISKEFPECQTLLGLSNVSFGLNPQARKVLNSVFLYEAQKKGLKSAIVHAGNLLPFNKIDEEVFTLALDLIYNRKQDALYRYIENNAGTGLKPVPANIEQNIESKLVNMIIDGNANIIEDVLRQALEKYKAIDIINKFLLDAMKQVGEFFGAGKMQLPFVLQSAETMKKAVDFLGHYLDSDKHKTIRGSIVLATVEGDVHDIGKNLLDIILTSNGYKVYNIGIKKKDEEVLEAVKKYNPDAIGLSGLLVSSTVIMGKNLEFFRENNIKLPVLLGGAALNKEFVEKELAKKYDGKVFYCKDAFAGLLSMNKLKSEQE
ncbi:homocysteine S-methyltransferase family protein [bacterium]|nr:homocysteine S-methyltransferase family protein [bacterium]